MLISYEEKLRIAQESLRQPSVNQIAEATGIHRSVVQKALNDPEIIELQKIFKDQVRSLYINAFASNAFASKKAKPSETEPNENESSKVKSSEVESSVSEEAELRIREVEALESIATSLTSLRSVLENAAKQKIPTQKEFDE